VIRICTHMIRLKIKTLFFFLCILSFTTLVLCGTAASDEISWNDGDIRWWHNEDGMDYAWREGKPVIIIVYTDWCPTCKKYGQVFQDERVVTESNKFIMVRINSDTNKELSLKYAFDGTYIPRTIALYPGGSVMHEIYPRKNYKYYIGTDANRLLKLMKDAYSKL